MLKKSEERFKKLFDNYLVSSNGYVISLYTGKKMKVSLRNGYERLKIKSKSYSVHQLVAMAFLGHKPCGLKIVVDHINGIRDDNRLENLRLISARDNVAFGRGSSKYAGVSKFRNKWRADIRVDGYLHYLGLFPDEESARIAYIKARDEFGIESKLYKS